MSRSSGKGLRKRIKAARMKMGLPPGLPFVVLTFRPNFMAGDRGVKGLVDAIKAAEAEFGVKCGLVVIDTVARAMSGAEETTRPTWAFSWSAAPGFRTPGRTSC